MDRKQIEKGWSSFIYPFSLSFLSVSYLFAIPSFSYPVFKCFSLVIIFLFLRWGQVPILRSIQYITYKYGDFQKASRISHVETSIPINSIIPLNVELNGRCLFWGIYSTLRTNMAIFKRLQEFPFVSYLYLL